MNLKKVYFTLNDVLKIQTLSKASSCFNQLRSQILCSFNDTKNSICIHARTLEMNW